MPELLSEVASPMWAYLVLIGLLAVDAFVPVVPTQIVMITGGALTVYGGLNLPMIILTGALGVFAGDLACYLLGRSAPDRREPRHPPGRARRAASRLTGVLRRPGPLVILLCRFVPGGRMAACFSAGRSRYPYRLFLTYELLAALGWSSYGALIGHLGGSALTSSAWRLAGIAVLAAAGFTVAGWAMTLLAARSERASGGVPAVARTSSTGPAAPTRLEPDDRPQAELG